MVGGDVVEVSPAHDTTGATAIAGERFEAGLMSQIELNDTITQQGKAEQLYLQATLDCLTAEAALERAVGGELWK